MSKSNDLSVFLATYGPSFGRTAYLLTGDADKARELAGKALVAACRRWSAIRYHRPADAVLRELYRRFLGATGARSPAPDGHPLAGLAPRTRAAVVVTLHDGLSLPHAATVTGLWVGALDDELRRARTHLRSSHPDLFTTPSDLPTTPDPPTTPDAPRPPDTASPWTLSDAPDTAASPWTLGTAAPPPSAFPETFPQTFPRAPGHQDAPAEDRVLRAVLLDLAAEMPHTDLAATVLNRVATRRRVRASVWTFATVGLTGTLVAMLAAGLSAVADNVNEAMARRSQSPGGPGYEIPGPLPTALPDPVGFAYPGYCRDSDVDAHDPLPCGQWVLTTRSGTEWRLPDARAGYDAATGAYMPLALSQDGHRLVYQNPQGRFLVHDLPTGVVKEIDATAGDGEARLGSSPDGRYFSLSFGDSGAGAVLDFSTGTTRTVRGQGVEILALDDDGTRVVSERRDATDVPGHASVSTLRLDGGRTRTRGFRVDPALVEHGAALAPDGRSLALVTADDELVTMDARTGRVAGPRTRLDEDDLEVVRVERWLSRDKVLVRLWDREDVYLTEVDVRTGEATVFDDSATDWIDYSDPLGALAE
ncbi:hypothetical protein ACFFV7_34620 [Nonomuraea spiralis]|uniref:Uncharacterized protein n=1 Tax=Nonomuraea spiralis TaxID=46182 RepID=A0ABV5IPA9_9ACTN|nr:hypothetical protein [Nonomuraea spiralis]GGT14884.1 hypothetical protein GCM10010176_069410 [Nonomuraea spiralis]